MMKSKPTQPARWVSPRANTMRLAVSIAVAVPMIIGVTAAIGGQTIVKPQPSATETGFEFFETKVRPVLIAECQPCHGPAKQMGGLRLDSRGAVLKGGGSGLAIVPGKPDASLMIRAISYPTFGLRMPPTGKL